MILDQKKAPAGN